jgi:flavin-dependent dehydrogenase
MIQNSIVVGGGLAGLIAAIHLKIIITMFCIEKMNFLNTKFVENIFQRSFTLLKILGLDINSLHPKHIDKLSFSLVSKIYKHSLPLDLE